MRFLEYLFFKYYNWQVKVGNADIASFSSICFMTLWIAFYFIDVLMSISFYIETKTIPKYIFFILFFGVFVFLYFSFIHHGKSTQIMEKHEKEWTGKKHLGAILFPIIAFIWFNANWIIKMLMNQRRI